MRKEFDIDGKAIFDAEIHQLQTAIVDLMGLLATFEFSEDADSSIHFLIKELEDFKRQSCLLMMEYQADIGYEILTKVAEKAKKAEESKAKAKKEGRSD